MKTTKTNESLPYNEFETLLISTLKSYPNVPYRNNMNSRVGNYPVILRSTTHLDWSISLEVSLKPQYLVNSSLGKVVVTEEEMDDFLGNFENRHFKLIKHMKEAIFSKFSELTNSDACSYEVKFDTNHASFTGDEGHWLLSLTITDYLS